ncbi:MAG: SDR family oxidoreductase [Planctomycetales bacterium]|nr:SDR family oxidoreductase [Planctomycetales bacterium]
MSDASEQYCPSVLITGCSSGIGLACARVLAAAGWRVFASVRNDHDAEQLVATGANVHPLIFDVTDEAMVQAAIAQVSTLVGSCGLDAIVNNAGIVVPGPMELLSTEDFHRQFAVNVFGVHTVIRAAMPLVRLAQLQRVKQRLGSARIVLIGSISGRVTPPYYGAYAASKHALEAMADAWRLELRPWKIAVSLIQPDSIATPIWNKVSHQIDELPDENTAEVAARYKEQLRSATRSSLTMGRTGLPTATVVSAVRRCLTARIPRSHYRVGLRTHAAVIASNLLPVRWMDYIMQRAMR